MVIRNIKVIFFKKISLCKKKFQVIKAKLKNMAVGGLLIKHISSPKEIIKKDFKFLRLVF